MEGRRKPAFVLSVSLESSMSVIVEHNGPVTTLIIDRPEARNAVDRPTADALAEALRAFEADEQAKVAVLTGAGGTFCAGADLAAVAEGSERRNRLEMEGDAPMGPSRMHLNKPLIAAIEGYAVAGGLELALLADLRVMAEDAVCGVFCRRFGVPLIDGGTVRLPRIIGQGRALDLILTGRPVAAQEALGMGLANRVVAKGEARAAAEDLARQIADFPQACMLADRDSVYAQWNQSFDVAMANEFQGGLMVILSGETQAGAQRFARGEGRHGKF
ncbi:enoyl-CoA hydratase [Pseudomonas sp. NBRC 100443]|nr:enoyl-CoA hydratase [Pseudomonas sp. NBRC 100443]